MFKIVNDCWFPETDNRGHNAIFDITALIEAEKLCTQRRTVIQAGGNVYVFVDINNDSAIDNVITLVGRTIADIGGANFI